MIQKALEKHSNTFVVLHVFKQTWRWNYHSMNVSSYWCIIGKWRMLKRLEGWIWYTTTNKGNNKKNKTSLKSMERCEMCWKVGAEETKLPLITRVLMQSCWLLHDPQRSHWGNVFVWLVSRNPVFTEFCELKNETKIRLNMPSMIFHYQQYRLYVALFDVVVGSVL